MMNIFKGLLGLVLIGSVMGVEANSEFPLRMDIDVSTRREGRNIGSGSEGSARVEKVSLRVKIRRASGSPHSEPLTAEVYVIGRQIHTGHFGIIDVVKEDFDFSEKRVFEVKTKGYALGNTTGNVNVGGGYETYLVVIADGQGKILETRSGRVIRDGGIDFIRELGPKTLFDRDGHVIGMVKKPNAAFKASVPAATNPRTSDF